MSYKVYNFRYCGGTNTGSVREVLVESKNDTPYLIEGIDRLVDRGEGGYRKFERKKMTEVTTYEAKVIECKDEKSAIELENLGGYDRFGSNVVVSKKKVPNKPETVIELRGTAASGYVKLSYGGCSIDLPLTGGRGDAYQYAWGGNYKDVPKTRDFEGMIEFLYNQIQKHK